MWGAGGAFLKSHSGPSRLNSKCVSRPHPAYILLTSCSQVRVPRIPCSHVGVPEVYSFILWAPPFRFVAGYIFILSVCPAVLAETRSEIRA